MKTFLKKHYQYALLFIGLTIGLSWISFNINTTEKRGWDSAYWADASGYYIYLPATFIYGYDISTYPEDIDAKMGYGFWLDKEKGKMATKYTMGIAMLTAPFFLFFHLLALITGQDASGFSPIYYNMPSVAGPFFLVLGLFFLFRFLRHYVNKKPALYALVAVVAGTNLYYFSIVSPYMTHVFSFAMFSVFLYALKKYIDKDLNSYKYVLLISFSAALIFLLRPTNLIVLLLIPLLDISSFTGFKERLKKLLKPLPLLLFLVTFLIIIAPQLIYWKFISGSYLFYSYGNEGFTYLSNPKILEVLIAPLNGMLLYNPVIFLLFVALIASVFKRKINALLFLIITLIALYIISSWGCYFYGCGYGCRPFIEYLALLTLPFALCLQNFKRGYRFLALLLTAYCILFNLRMINNIFQFSRCFLGGRAGNIEYLEGEQSRYYLWNWHEYRNYVDKTSLFPLSSRSYTWKNDFEPGFTDYFFNENKRLIKQDDAPSGQYVTSTENEFADGFYYVNKDRICLRAIKKIEVESLVKNTEEGDNHAFLVCQINSNDSTVLWESRPLINMRPDKNGWEYFKDSFDIPYLGEGLSVSIYFWSPDKNRVLIDDMRIKFRY